MAGFREFLTGEVLTAANVNSFLMQQAVMVFADDAARTTALTGVVAEGMLTYNLDTKALEVFDGAAFGPVVTAKEKRVDGFTGSGTFTVPAGVTYAIAHVIGGGGGASNASTVGGNGSDSTVAFASGTVTGPGGQGFQVTTVLEDFTATGGPANSGRGAIGAAMATRTNAPTMNMGASANYVVAGAAVTPAASITVTVGAGGNSPTGGDGGSGYVYIEYFEEV